MLRRRLLGATRNGATRRLLGLQTWVDLALSAFGMQREQASAAMRLAHILAPPTGNPQPMPRDEVLRVPLGSILLLLWVQWAQHSIGQGLTLNNLKSQAASGDVWPSLLLPPAAAASANVVDGGVRPNARTLAVRARLQTPLARQRLHVLQAPRPSTPSRPPLITTHPSTYPPTHSPTRAPARLLALYPTSTLSHSHSLHPTYLPNPAPSCPISSH